MDSRFKESFKEVKNQSLQSYLKNNKITTNRVNSVDSNDLNNNINNAKHSNKGKIKLANLFESLPNFNNTVYKKSLDKIYQETHNFNTPKNNIVSNIDANTYSKTPKLPMIKNTKKSEANNNIRKSFDFCQNTTQLSSLGDYFKSPNKSNNLSNPNLGYITNSKRITTLTFDPINTNIKPKLSKNDSQISLKNVKSYYEENFKNRHSIIKDFKKFHNDSESIVNNKNTILEKIVDCKKNIREITNKHYLSTENFNQINPRNSNFYNERSYN